MNEMEQLKRDAAWGKALWDWLRDMLPDAGLCVEFDSEDLMRLAEKHGRAKKVPFNPEIHGFIDAEPGHEIWWWGDDLQPTAGSDLVTREEHERAVEGARAMTALNLFGPEIDQLRAKVDSSTLFREQLAALMGVSNDPRYAKDGDAFLARVVQGLKERGNWAIDEVHELDEQHQRGIKERDQLRAQLSAAEQKASASFVEMENRLAAMAIERDVAVRAKENLEQELQAGIEGMRQSAASIELEKRGWKDRAEKAESERDTFRSGSDAISQALNEARVEIQKLSVLSTDCGKDQERDQLREQLAEANQWAENAEHEAKMADTARAYAFAEMQSAQRQSGEWALLFECIRAAIGASTHESILVHVERLKADKEKAEKACAEMRDLLTVVQHQVLPGLNLPAKYTVWFASALSTDCGKGYIALEDRDELLILLQSIVSAQHNAKGWVERLEAMRGDSARIGRGEPEGD